MREDEILKRNIIQLVKQHKDGCTDPECGVSMLLTERLIKKAGIKLTKEESAIFI